MAKKDRKVVRKDASGKVWTKKKGVVQPVCGKEAEDAVIHDLAAEKVDAFMELTDGRPQLVERNGVIREVILNQRTPAALVAFANRDKENFLAAAMPGGIERQEAEAQARLVSTQQIPIKLGSPKELFDKLGFKFGRQVDKMLQEAELPKGWTKVPHPGHSMYSYVLDDKGRARWTIFFKGAFYDYEAFGWGLQKRYQCRVQKDYDFKGPGEKPVWGEVLDHGVKFDPKESYHGGVKPKVVYRSQEKHFIPKSVWDHERVDRMVRLEMELWIDAQYPNHEDPLAYWD